MPIELKSRAREAVIRHRHVTLLWPDQAWRAFWPNPVSGEEALYIASHAHAVKGMSKAKGQALINELIDWATQDHYVYTHRWQPGDVLVWDERATLHRGRPWPYDEERTLTSLCVSAQDNDGLAAVRPPGAV